LLALLSLLAVHKIRHMATLTVRNLDAALKARLRVRAAEHGRSMEAEARAILRETLLTPAGGPLGSRIHQRFATVGGVEIDEPSRADMPRAADLHG
jgi:antitoxin FitA